VRPFQPPPGFREPQSDAPDSAARTLEALSGDLTGKEIWHITASPGIPIDAIQELSLDAMRSGSPILTYKERQYSLKTGNTSSRYFLLPQADGTSYRLSNQSVHESRHLQEIPRPLQTKDGHTPETFEFFATEKPASRIAVQQPRNLQMRFRPFGASDNVVAFNSNDGGLGAEKSDSQFHADLSSQHQEATPMEMKTKKKKKRSKESRPNDLVESFMQTGDDSIQVPATQGPSPSNTMSAVEVPDDDGEVVFVKSVEKKRKKKHREMPSYSVAQR
jgi:hypothetical protein